MEVLGKCLDRVYKETGLTERSQVKLAVQPGRVGCLDLSNKIQNALSVASEANAAEREKVKLMHEAQKSMAHSVPALLQELKLAFAGDGLPMGYVPETCDRFALLAGGATEEMPAQAISYLSPPPCHGSTCQAPERCMFP